MQKVIIDTDIGDDIDDALALSLAIESPELEIIGITTVFKNTNYRTKMTLELLEAYGRGEIPVATGIGKPIFEKVDVDEVPVQWSDEFHSCKENCNLHAVDFILETIEKHPGVKVVAIGPLTNIAAAYMKDPGRMKSVELVIMAGMYSSFYPEWNIFCDPEAARVVFESGMDITMIGLDVTLQCRLTDEDVEAIKASDLNELDVISGLLTRWMDDSKHLPILHDPLVIGYLTHPELLDFERKLLHVECQGEFSRGMTVEEHDAFFGREPKETNVKVATKVNAKAFRKLFLERLFQ